MARDYLHRSHKAPGGHKPYQNQKPGQQAKQEPTAQDQATTAQHQATEYLRRTIGGQWRFVPEKRIFEAEFNSRIADAIAGYLQTQAVSCRLEDLGRNDETRMSLTIAQYSAVKQHIRLKPNERNLAHQYSDAAAMSRRLLR